MVTIALCKKDTQPSQTCSEGYTFPATVLHRGVSVDVCGRCGVIEESFALWERFGLTVNKRFRERAIRSYLTIGRVGPSERDFASQSEIIVW